MKFQQCPTGHRRAYILKFMSKFQSMMALEAALVKLVIFISNPVFALGGLAILGVGIAVRLAIANFTDRLDTKLNVAPWLFITVGSLVFVLAVFGCCGAIRESLCMVITYTVLLSFIILIQIVLAVALLVYNTSDLHTHIQAFVVPLFVEATSSNDAGASFSALEIELSCCGTTGPSSYGKPTVPPSCCGAKSTVFQQGCVEALTDYIHPRLTALGSVVLVVAAVEIVSVIFGCCLAVSIKRDNS